MYVHKVHRSDRTSPTHVFNDYVRREGVKNHENLADVICTCPLTKATFLLHYITVTGLVQAGQDGGIHTLEQNKCEAVFHRRHKFCLLQMTILLPGSIQ